MDVRELKDKASQLFSKGKFAKAAETYDEYCRADLKDLQARLRLGDAWAKAGKKDKAVTAYTWAAEGFAKEGFLPRAIAASKLVLEVDPTHKGVQKMLADLYAQKSSSPSRIGKAPTAPGLADPAGLPEISRATAAQGTASAFANRADAIDLDAPPAPGAKPAHHPPSGAPSPMNRADAIEVPEFALPLETGHSSIGGVAASRGPSPMTNAAAIEVPEFELPLETGRSSIGGVAAARGPSPTTNTHAIEVNFEDARPSGPAPLVETQVQLDLSAPSAGEVEIAIEDAAPVQGSPIEEPPPSAEAGLSHILASLPTLQVPVGKAAPAAAAQQAATHTPVDEPQTAEERWAAARAAAVQSAVAHAAGSQSVATELPPPAPLPISFELEVDVPAPSAPIFELEVVEEAELAPDPEPPQVPAPLPLAPPEVPIDAAPPPGLRPRKGETPAVPPLADAPSPFQSTPSRIRLPTTFAAGQPSANLTLDPVTTDLERSLQAFMQHEEPKPPPYASTPSAIAASFTELELEADSLLHAVEAAAATPEAGPAPALEEAMEAPDEPRAEAGALPRIPLFSDLPPDAFIALFEQCPLRRFDEGHTIIEQGTTGDSFFVICAGRVKVFRTDGPQRREVAVLDEGAFFGEMALLSHAPRSASIVAAGEDTQVLEISAALLTDLSAKYPTVAQALKKFCRQRLLANLMASAPLFRPFSRGDRRELIQKFRARDVRVGDLVVREGSPCDGLYVVLSGEVEVRVKGVRVAALREGEIFGEMSLLTKTAAGASVVSTRHTSLLRLPRADFDALITSYPQILEHVAELTDARRQRNALV